MAAAVAVAAAAQAAAAAEGPGVAAAAAQAAWQLLQELAAELRSAAAALHWPELRGASGRPALLLLQQLLQRLPLPPLQLQQAQAAAAPAAQAAAQQQQQESESQDPCSQAGGAADNAAAAAGASASCGAHDGRGEQLSGRRLRQLCELLVDMCWEKLHTGHWADVAVAWRDCYSLACALQALLHVALLLQQQEELPPAVQQQPAAADAAATAAQAQTDQPPHPQQQQQQQQQQQPLSLRACLSSGLRQLDLAAMMGGPRLRPWVDRAAALLEGWLARLDDDGGQGQQGQGQQGQMQQLQEQGHEAQQQEAPAGQQGQHHVAGSRVHKRQKTNHAPAAGAPATAAAAAAAAEAAGAATPVPLPPGSLSSPSYQLPRLPAPSLEHFALHYMPQPLAAATQPPPGHPAAAGSPRHVGRPVVLTGVIEHWPARTRWAHPSYFCTVAGYRTVPVEVGQHYLAEGWGTRLMTVGEFVTQHLLQQRGDGPSEDAAAAGAEGKQEEGAEVQQQVARQLQAPCSQLAAEAGAGTTRAGSSSSSGSAATDRSPSGTQPGQQHHPQQQRGYLAQHALFDQLPALAADIATPDYCSLGAGELVATNAWIGPAGTVTPLHTDPHNNLLAQVAGSKYVRLYSPQCGAAMYAHTEGLVTNSSRVDLDDVDEGQFPLFGGAPWLECVLGPGDVLYIPPGWWHYVKALSVSCSVSFWWR